MKAVEKYLAVIIYIWMINRCQEIALWRSEWIIARDEYAEEEHAAFISRTRLLKSETRILRASERSLPVLVWLPRQFAMTDLVNHLKHLKIYEALTRFEASNCIVTRVMDSL